MKQLLNYDIHNMKICLERDKKFDLTDNFDLELSFFKVDSIQNPDIIYKVGKFKPSNEDCYTVDHKYYVKDNYFYCKDGMNGLKWELEIQGFDKGEMIVNYNYSSSKLSKFISRFNFDTLFLRPLIFFKLKDKGKIMIHGGGVSKKDKAYIFPGRGGVYKTSLIMNLIKKADFSYLGDDWIILDESKIFNFPVHFPLFNFTYTEKRTEFLNYKDKMRFIISLDKYKENKNGIKISNPCNLSSIIFMSRSNQNSDISIKKLELNNALDKLVENIKLEMMDDEIPLSGFSFGQYYNYICAYSYIFPDSKIANNWKTLKNELQDNLGDICIYEVEVPQNYNSQIVEEVLKIIGD